MVIQQLLMDAGVDDVGQDLVEVEPVGLEVAADWRTLQSPETYTGYGQSTGFAQEDVARFDEPQAYVAPRSAAAQLLGACPGPGRSARHAAVSNEPGGRIAFRFHARDVNLVMGPASRGAAIPFRVLLDGQVVTADHGTDLAADGRGVVTTSARISSSGSTAPIVRSDRRDRVRGCRASRPTASRSAERRAMAHEEPLVGGMDPRFAPVRVGDTVRRPPGSSGAAVGELLLHLESVGFDGRAALIRSARG